MNRKDIGWVTVRYDDDGLLYGGCWNAEPEPSPCSRSNRQFSYCLFTFRGPVVRWIGSLRDDQGFAEIFLDGEPVRTVDGYSERPQTDVVKFEASGLSPDRIHCLKITVSKKRNARARNCYQDIGSFQAAEPVCYPAEMTAAMRREYTQILAGRPPLPDPSEWKPVAESAAFPVNGVRLLAGLFRESYDKNIRYLLHCNSSPTYCDGTGWSQWLPASNEARMLAIAANALRWEERADLRQIVNGLVLTIKNRMREDGYYDYYPEEESYGLTTGADSERKNYDRVFWTRGLLAAGLAGHPDAYPILRKMYDWFNHCAYLPVMLEGSNATNGLPGGPLMKLSPAGADDDLITTMKYYDQSYWMAELKNKEPLCVSHYPGERPHCYELLGLEAFIDEYKATGARRYLDAALGGWEIYQKNFKHVGGATAICESDGPYPPQSYYLSTGHNGETCGSVFWIHLNHKLMLLFPDREKYAAEIEESVYNILLAAQDDRGFIRYHNRLQGIKENALCQNTCCEVSATALIARIPELIYSISADGLYINLYTSSTIAFTKDGNDVRVTCQTDFPFAPGVTIDVETSVPVSMNIHIRIPCWVKQNMQIKVNDDLFAAGAAGSYLSIGRVWMNHTRIQFNLNAGFLPVHYTGLDQTQSNDDRYALMYGPVLMALKGKSRERNGIPLIRANPDALPEQLIPAEVGSMEYLVPGDPGYRYAPYWEIRGEPFSCFPIIQEDDSETTLDRKSTTKNNL